MTTLFRLDARLVHATLMNAWVPFVRASELVVADAEVASNPRTRTILAMSAMDVPILFVSEREVGSLLAKREGLGARIVIFSSLGAVERALDAGLEAHELNIGHLPESPGRKALLPAVHLGPEDCSTIERLEHRGVRVFVQSLPRDPRQRVVEIERASACAIPPVPRTPSVREQPVPRPPPLARALTPGPAGSRRVSIRLRIVNERGLHLRAAHAFANLAASLQDSVQVANGPDFVNAKSLLGLTTLGATLGAIVEVVVTGAQPEKSLERIKALFASGFGEGARPGMTTEVDV